MVSEKCNVGVVPSQNRACHGQAPQADEISASAGQSFRQTPSFAHAWRVAPLVVGGAGDREREDRMRAYGTSGNDGRTVKENAGTKPGKFPRFHSIGHCPARCSAGFDDVMSGETLRQKWITFSGKTNNVVPGSLQKC
jgi:hypothetical protein